VFDGEDSLVAALVEGVDDGSPVDLAQSGNAVAPPADIPGVFADDGASGPAVMGASLGEHLDVLGLGVGDAVDVGPDGVDRVDAHPHQV
jgi:hypothetical protein